jgi:KDO2-lipid IV(A) lauroyltransferase
MLFRSRRKPKLKKLLINYLSYFLGKIICTFLGEFPLSLTRPLLGKLCRFCYYFLPQQRELAFSHLEMALAGETTRCQRRKITGAMYENMGKNLADFIAMPRLRKRDVVSMVDGSDYLPKVQEALKRGRGLIVATGHLGNWELFAAYSACFFKTSVVARRLHFEKYDKEVIARRKRLGMEVIYQSDGVRPIIKALRNNHVIGILLDQDIKDASGVFTDFFGKKAYTVTAPFSIAQTVGSPILPAATVRLPDDRYKVIVHDFLPLERTGDKSQDRMASAQRWSTIFEQFIRQYPQQWVWFHRRWKTRPKDKL